MHEEKPEAVDDEIYVAAYVWPSCHYEERNATIPLAGRDGRMGGDSQREPPDSRDIINPRCPSGATRWMTTLR